LTRTSSFEESANALIIADKRLNQDQNEKVIYEVFIERGIFPNPTNNNRSSRNKKISFNCDK
jgi:hypothetical protein